MTIDKDSLDYDPRADARARGQSEEDYAQEQADVDAKEQADHEEAMRIATAHDAADQLEVFDTAAALIAERNGGAA